MAIMAVLMCVNFASCSNEEVVPDEEVQDKYITVGLKCVGEFLNITESPLSRSTSNDTYEIQVYSVDENGYTTPYAYGTFETSLDGLTIKLLQGQKYKFRVAITIKGRINDYFDLDEDFNYSSTIGVNWGNDFIPISTECEGYYGELDEYSPEESQNVEIYTKRVSYAAKFIAENLSEGTLDIIIYRPGSSSKDYISLTPSIPENDNIYSFNDKYNAWKGIYTQTGTDSETGESIYEYKDYSSKKTLEIKWTKDDGTVTPFGTYKVTFKRNVRTTIRINVAEIPSVSNGITVTKEETAITDDENEYEISGGEIVEVPVNSES